MTFIVISLFFPTSQTNKEDTFRAIQSADRPNEVGIFLAKPLQYERVRVYTLTLQVRRISREGGIFLAKFFFRNLAHAPLACFSMAEEVEARGGRGLSPARPGLENFSPCPPLVGAHILAKNLDASLLI